MGQADPQAGAADDDVVHGDPSAFVDEWGAGFVQDHSCFVASSRCLAVTPRLATDDGPMVPPLHAACMEQGQKTQDRKSVV